MPEYRDLTPDNIEDYGVCGYKDVTKHKELRSKIAWFKRYYPLGLRIKALIAKDGSYQGMIEYLPGEYAHRPVDAEGYLFIHCVFVGFKKEHKGRGYATAMIEAVIREAMDAGKNGVAVVTRKGSFMIDAPIFLKLGFEVADRAKPDFQLLVKRFHPDIAAPRFKSMNNHYDHGLTILRSPQCPYTEKNVMEMMRVAKADFRLDPQLIDLDDHNAAQKSPCPFGTFCIVHEGEVVAHHPISRKRFENIMTKRMT